MKTLISSIMAATVFFAMSATQADIKSDKQSVDSACVQEAATAGCGSEQVGTGLLKCLHTYKEKNQSAQFSDACKAVLKTLQTDFKSDKQSIDSACAQEAATAGCGTEQVGSGLLKCLHTYKESNSTFKFSDACKSAIDVLHADIKK